LDGNLLQYQLEPHGPNPGEQVDPRTLKLTVTQSHEWAIGRKDNWKEYASNFLSSVEDKEEEEEKEPEQKYDLSLSLFII
jgi:hypothetical protein